MFYLLLAFQITIQDSVYSTPGLKQFIAEASAINRTIPPGLSGYRATAETDVAALVRNAQDQAEQTQRLEQIESTITWARTSGLVQHIIGYRTENLGVNVSALTILRRPWVIPVLYGDRLQFLSLSSDPSDSTRYTRIVSAVHPLASDRDAVYSFTGGDTVATVSFDGRMIHVMRVHVAVRRAPPARTMVFTGDIDFDADRKHIIRMRGQIAEVQSHVPFIARAIGLPLNAFAFVDLSNEEIDGQYWLPTYQRLEIQLRSRIATDFRPAVRIVTSFRDHEILDESHVRAFMDTARGARITYAKGDSISGFAGWAAKIGLLTASVDAADFDDIAPETYRTTGKPKLDFNAERTSDIFHFNRVEGVFTGADARYSFRDAYPGLVITGKAGWAWSERTARGGVTARLQQPSRTLGASVERTLDNTNDFIRPLDGDATWSALLASVDDFDYVDRYSARVFGAFNLGAAHAWRLTAEAGPGYDGAESRRLLRGIIRLDSIFRPNRPVLAGSYMREMVGLELHPRVNAASIAPGIGGAVQYERGDGEVRWQRIDARLVARHVAGNFNYAARMDAATVFGGVPPQKVIELGHHFGLSGYGYKAFGGDRAVLMRSGVNYNLPILQTPLRLMRGIFIPNVHPGFGIALDGGWAAASSQAARDVLVEFGYAPDKNGVPQLITRPTDGVQATFSAFITLFGGAAGIGVARPFGRSGPWKLYLGGLPL